MPFSDNLYSGNDESDAESFSDELSPTDGYFNRSNMPTNTLVPDPSQASNSSEDKVLIARREARQNSEMGVRAVDSPTLSQLYPSHTDASAAASDYSPSPPVSNIPSSPISSRRTDDLYSEHTPLMPARAPPPAYSASPTSPIAPILPETRTYSTFEQHLELGFPPRHEPQSMGAPTYDPPSERTPLSGVSNERDPLPKHGARRSSLCRTFIRKLLFFALVVTVLTALLTTMLKWKRKADDRSPDYSKPSGPYCPSARIKKPEDVVIYDFGTNKDLTVVQTTYEGDDSAPTYHINTRGEIRLRRLPKDSTLGAHFKLDVRVSDPDLEVMQNWDSHSRILKVSTPRHAKLNSSGPHCISVEVTAWIPEDARIANLLVSSVELSLRVLEDVKINLSGHAKLASVSGGIHFPAFKNSKGKKQSLPDFQIPGYSFDSRRIDIETVSGSISGLYPLADHLGLYSQSGDVTVGVFPRPIDPDNPAQAELDVKTASGTINIHLPLLGLENPKFTPPPRDYVTQVRSTSGSISGSYYLGSATRIKGTSSTLSLTVLPVVLSSGKGSHYRAAESAFETRTESGTTKIEILEPVFASLLSSEKPENPKQPKNPYQPIGGGDPYLLLPPMEGELFEEDDKSLVEEQTWRSLRSIHGSTSGTISVRYPPAWEGTILAKTVTGNIAVTGNGVKTIREKNGWGSREVFAKKGVDNEYEGSTAELRGITGTLKFTIYDP